MGVSSLTVFDFDTLEEHNQPASFYSVAQYDTPKVDALAANIAWLNGVAIQTFDAPYHGQVIEEVVILAVDSLQARRDIVEQVIDGVNLIVDARSGRSLVEVYTLFPQNQDRAAYLASLEEGSNVARLPCSERAVAYNAMTVAGLVGGIVASYARGDWAAIPSHLVVDHGNWVLIAE